MYREKKLTGKRQRNVTKLERGGILRPKKPTNTLGSYERETDARDVGGLGLGNAGGKG